MFIADYHIHTNHSFDSFSNMNQVCKNAILRGLKEICFTEHFSVISHQKTYGHMDFDNYFSEIRYNQKVFGSQLEIKAGLELCEPHLRKREYETVLKDLNIDFLLGAVHHIEEQDLPTFIQGKSSHEIYQRYFEEVYELVSHADIDVLAHVDFIKRYAIEYVGNYTFDTYKDILMAILKKAVDRGIGIEINMAGYHDIKLNEPYPSMELLKLYRSLGGEILTIGSDAHLEGMVGLELDAAVEMAKEAGLTYLFTFESREAKAVKLDAYAYDR